MDQTVYVLQELLDDNHGHGEQPVGMFQLRAECVVKSGWNFESARTHLLCHSEHIDNICMGDSIVRLDHRAWPLKTRNGKTMCLDSDWVRVLTIIHRRDGVVEGCDNSGKGTSGSIPLPCFMFRVDKHRWSEEAYSTHEGICEDSHASSLQL